MAEDPPSSRHVAFAERFAAEPVNTFNAYASMERARLLMREAQQIEELYERERDLEDSAPWAWHGLEVVPYTLVGLATCLEWHARSRLTDLYSYKPDSIEPKVLEGKVAPRVLSQMIKARVSIPQLLGASITIGSAKEYLTIFNDLFSILDIAAKPESIIQPPIIEQIGLFGDPIHVPRVRDRLDELFATRHALVHEIGQGASARRTYCEIWGPSQVIEMCRMVIGVITKLERALTKHAPSDFPNLLTQDGYPVDERAQLASSIAELEDSIGAEIAARHPSAQADWAEALSNARKSLAAHERFFEDRKSFEQRFAGRANSLSRSGLRLRVALLTEIAAELAKTRAVSNC